MGTWNHRVVQIEDPDGTPLFGVFEVHYENGIPYARTEDPAVLGETIEVLRGDLERMLKALDTPILTDKDIGHE